MRLKQSLVNPGPTGLSPSELREVEDEFGVFLLAPAAPTRSANQQLGVFDQNNRHAEDITASSKYFTMADLRQKVGDVCKRCGE